MAGVNKAACAAVALLLGASAARGQGDRALILNNEGVERLGRGEIGGAIEKFSAARALDPRSPAVRANLACAYLRQAEDLAGKGDAEGAVRWLDEAVSLDVRLPVVKNNLAAVYNDIAAVRMRDGRYADAISLLQTAAAIKPDSAVLRANLGAALYRDNRREEALDEFRAVLAADPDNALAHKMCGLILYWKGQTQEALNELALSARQNPSDTEVAGMLARIQREYGVEKEFDVDSQANFTVSFDGRKDYRIGRAVLDALEAARSKAGADFNFYPREKIAVVIYSGREFHDLLDRPKNIGGLYDGKIRVPAGGLDTDRERDALYAVLAHEYAHVMVHFLTHGRCPLWLNEGIAEYESAAPERGRELLITGALARGAMIPLKDLSGALRDVSSARIGLAYAEASSVVKFIADRYGVYTLRRILDGIESGDDANAAIRKALSIDMEGLEKAWLESLKG